MDWPGSALAESLALLASVKVRFALMRSPRPAKLTWRDSLGVSVLSSRGGEYPAWFASRLVAPARAGSLGRPLGLLTARGGDCHESTIDHPEGTSLAPAKMKNVLKALLSETSRPEMAAERRRMPPAVESL